MHAADRVWAVSLCLHQFRVLGTAVVAGAWAPAAAFTALATSGIAALHNGRTTPSQREHELSSTRRKILGLVSREVVSRHLDAWGAHCDAKARARSLLDQAGRFQVLM